MDIGTGVCRFCCVMLEAVLGCCKNSSENEQADFKFTPHAQQHHKSIIYVAELSREHSIYHVLGTMHVCKFTALHMLSTTTYVGARLGPKAYSGLWSRFRMNPNLLAPPRQPEAT